MPFVHIEADAIRIIEHAVCEPHPRLNIIFGENASGKSSLLEAIGFLSLGRSFRTPQTGEVIRRGAGALRVFGIHREDAHEQRVGIELTPGGRTIRIDQQPASLSALAAIVPLQALNPDAHRTFFLEAAARRQTLAWSLFHVEPRYPELWARFTRALKQRNAALRQGAAPQHWDLEVTTTGEALGALASEHLKKLRPRFERYSKELLGLTPGLEYACGWPAEVTLAAALEQDRIRDRERGFTHAGPHRADVILGLEGYVARFQASHGQQKLLLLAFRFAQLELVHCECGRASVVLIDDLPADLDRSHRSDALRTLAALDTQAFVTTTERELLPTISAAGLFHVERGDVRRVS